MFSIIAKFFGGIPTLYLWLGLAVGVAGWSVYMDHRGYVRAENKAAAARLKEVVAAQKLYNKELARGNALADKLAKQEAVIVYRTQEKIKYVTQVTSNRACLSRGAVSVLNGAADPDQTRSTSEPDAEDAAPAASDTDVYLWIAEAQGYYTTCATRLNALIDYEQPQSQPAVE